MEYFEHLFRIDNIWLFPPDGYQEEPIPEAGIALDGKPIRQGYPTFTFTWTLLKQHQMTRMMEVYDPAFPSVTVTFIDKATGELVQRRGVMHEPIVGARQIVYYNNVALKISRVEPLTIPEDELDPEPPPPIGINNAWIKFTEENGAKQFASLPQNKNNLPNVRQIIPPGKKVTLLSTEPSETNRLGNFFNVRYQALDGWVKAKALTFDDPTI